MDNKKNTPKTFYDYWAETTELVGDDPTKPELRVAKLEYVLKNFINDYTRNY